MTLSRGRLLADPVLIGTGAAGGTIRILGGNDTNYIDLKSPDGLAADYTLTLPSNDGDPSQVLQTNGSGVTSWVTVSATPGGSNTQIQYNNSGSFAGSAALTTDGSNLLIDSQGDLRLGDGTNFLAFQAPASIGADRTYTLPATIGTAGQVLKIDTGPTATSATLVWADDDTGGAGTSPGGSDTHVQFNNAGSFGGDAGFTYNLTTDSATLVGSLTAGGVDVTTGNDYQINSVSVLNATTLGSGVTGSSLTSVGTLGSVTVSGASALGLLTLTSNSITTTGGNNNIDLDPHGTGNVRLLGGANLILSDDDDSNSVTIAQPAAVTSNYTLTLPAAIGAADDVLAIDGTGQISFVSNARTINFIIDGGGSAITAGTKGYLQVDFDCEIVAYTILTDNASSTIQIDVNKSTFAGFPGSLASITASATPSVTGAQSATSTTLTGWTTTISAGDVLEFQVDGTPANATLATLALKVRMT